MAKSTKATKATKATGDYYGIPYNNPDYTEQPSNVIQAPENISHHFMPPDGILQVDMISVDSQGNMPDDPPKQYQAPGFHHGSTGEIVWPEPHAVYRSDGSVETAGFIPGGTWVDAEDPKVVKIHGTDVLINWSDRNGNSGVATPVLVNPDTALFWFYSPNNIEVVCSIVGPINGQSLIKVGSLTAEAFRLTATKGGQTRELEQRQDAPLGAITLGFPE